VLRQTHLCVCVSVYKGKQKSEATEKADDNSPNTTTTMRGRRHTTAGDIGRLLNSEPGQRIQRLEFQFHSHHRRKPMERSISAQWHMRVSADVYVPAVIRIKFYRFNASR